MNYGMSFVTLYKRQGSRPSHGKKCKKAKWLSGEALQIAVKRREVFRKGRGTRDQMANIHWIMEKAREFQKNIYFCSIDYAKAFDCVDHNKLWKILK